MLRLAGRKGRWWEGVGWLGRYWSTRWPARPPRKGIRAFTTLLVAVTNCMNRRDLKTVTQIAQHVADNLVTVGASLGRCSVPGRHEDVEEALGADELEIGMGIHNEPGCKRVSPIPSHSELVTELLGYLLKPAGQDPDRGFLTRKPTDKLVLLVNNLGGLSNFELNILVGETIQQLNISYNITPVRVFAGPFMTALNAPGFSITLLGLPEEGDITPTTVLDLLDAFTSATGWSNSIKTSTWTSPPTIKTPTSPSKKKKVKELPKITCKHVPTSSITQTNISQPIQL
jgi:dihydroxyacetone kinase